MTTYYKSLLAKLGIQGAYRGLAFTALKDSVGFALFFGTFETGKRIIGSYLTPITIQPTPTTTSWSHTLRNASTVILAGICSGFIYQVVDYPLERVRTLLLIRAGQLEYGVPYIKNLYGPTYQQVRVLVKREGLIPFLYKGLPASLYKAVPVTAIGFMCYEGLRQTLEAPHAYYKF